MAKNIGKYGKLYKYKGFFVAKSSNSRGDGNGLLSLITGGSSNTISQPISLFFVGVFKTTKRPGMA